MQCAMKGRMHLLRSALAYLFPRDLRAIPDSDTVIVENPGGEYRTPGQSGNSRVTL